MSVPIYTAAQLLFAVRNADKAVHGDPFRGGVAAANGAKVCSSVFSGSKVATKLGNIAGDVVTPLLLLSSGYNVYKSDDKVKTAAKSGCGLAGMFLSENLMKKDSVSSFTKNSAEWIMKKCTKNQKAQNVGTFILTGLAFFAASALGYDIAAKAGESAVDIIRKSNPEKVNADFYANYELQNDVSNLDEKA